MHFYRRQSEFTGENLPEFLPSVADKLAGNIGNNI